MKYCFSIIRLLNFSLVYSFLIFRITQATKVTNKVRSRVRMDENGVVREGGSGESQCSDRDNKEEPSSSGPSTPRGDAPRGAFGTEENSPGKSTKTNNDDSEVKIGLHKILSSKAEALLNKKGITWPWKGRENDAPDCKNQVTWPSLHGEQENDQNHPKISDTQVAEYNQPNKNEASGSWSSFNNNSSSSASSTGSTNSSALYKIDHEADCLDYEILWEDLVIGEQVGQGSCFSFCEFLCVSFFITLKFLCYFIVSINGFRIDYLVIVTGFVCMTLLQNSSFLSYLFYRSCTCCITSIVKLA